MDNLKTYAAVCGIFCKSCSLYIANQENDKNRLKYIADKLNTKVEDIICHGCRSDQLSAHCKSCNFIKCAKSKNIDFCSQCSNFPCEDIKNFQIAMPHRAELFESLDLLKNISIEKWTEKMLEDFSCSKCNTINSVYDINCRVCNEKPSNNFVKRNINSINLYLKKQKQKR